MKKLSYLKKLICFAYKNNPILAVFPIISIISISAEMLAMMSLLPLSAIVTSQQLSTKDPIVRLLNFFDVTPNPKILFMTFCFLFILRIISNVIAQNISLKYGKRVLAQLASKAFSNIVKDCRLNEIEQKSIGHYISLAGDESFRASTIVIEIHQLISILMLGGLYFVLICWYSAITAISLFLFLGLSFLFMGSTFRRTHRLGETQILQSQAASSIFLDALNGLRTVRSFMAEDFVVNAYRSQMYNYTQTLYKIDFTNILIKFTPIAFLFIALGTFLIWDPFDKFATQGFNAAFTITIILFLMRFFPVVGQGLNVLMRLISDAKAARDVIEIIVNQEDRGAGKLELDEKIKSVVIDNLSFSYKLGTPVFENLNINFESGKSYVLLGPSGKGKSTLFNILAFLNEVQSGDVRINNKSYAKYKLESLRRKVILVEQQSIIFNDTVFNNINLGEEYDIQSVMEACKIACIDEYIANLTDNYNFKLNYQGQNLSGGQRQRIGIARAMLRNPDVLLLDEVTSALDEVTKRNVIENILEHFKDKIVIFITHDQAVVEHVDVVVSLEGAPAKEENLKELELV